MIDLTNYSIPELKNLLNQVQQQISGRDAEARARARQDILAIAKGAGIELQDLVRGLKPAKVPVPAQYQNPEDPSEQWSGRGRKPRWLKEFLDSGKTLDQVRIA